MPHFIVPLILATAAASPLSSIGGSLGEWGTFLFGVASVLTLFFGLRGIKWGLRWAAIMLRPKVTLERDRADAVKQRDQSITEAESARREAVAAHNEAVSWRSSYDGLEKRIKDIESRVLPKLNAALIFIRALLEYIGHLEDAITSAQVRFPITMRTPEIPVELTDDIPPSLH